MFRLIRRLLAAAPLFLLILLLVCAGIIGGSGSLSSRPWPCPVAILPSLEEEVQPCWAYSCPWSLSSGAAAGDGQDVCADLLAVEWNCSKCSEIGRGSFGEVYIMRDKTVQTCPDFTFESFRDLGKWYNSWVPSAESDDYGGSLLSGACVNNERCDVGHYKAVDETGQDYCRPCVAQQVGKQCAPGYFYDRCVLEGRDGCGAHSRCTLPVIPNATTMEYGLQVRLPSCQDQYCTAGTSDCNNVAMQNAFRYGMCIFPYTPDWDSKVCSVQCKRGYARRQPAQHSLIVTTASPWRSSFFGVEMPACELCVVSSQCGSGFRAPRCEGVNAVTGAVVEEGPDCVACSASILPQNAIWQDPSPACEWTCRQGYWKNTATSSCVKCNAGNVTSLTSANVLTWQGCRDVRPASATTCPQQVAYNSYINLYQPWLDRCVTTRCSAATTGVNYVKVPCSLYADAVLENCTVCSASTQFLVSACGAYANTVCQACSLPSKNGMLLVRGCNATHDAIYTDCPAGKACDGTTVVRTCPSSKRPYNGQCVCFPAFVSDADGNCVPVQCQPGYFPDAFADERWGWCSPCRRYPSTTGYSPLSTGGVAGVEACYCPRNYVLKEDYKQFDPQQQAVECHKCVDIQCDAAYYRQSDCPGGRSTDIVPQCLCQLPPGGVEKLDATPCAFECAPGLLSVAAANFAPMRREGALTFLGDALEEFQYMDILSSSSSSWSGASYPQNAVVLGTRWNAPDAAKTKQLLLFVVNGNELWGVDRREDGEWLEQPAPYRVDLESVVFPSELSRGAIQKIFIHENSVPDAGKSTALADGEIIFGLWVAFTYQTDFCEGRDPLQEEGGVISCSNFVRLVIVEQSRRAFFEDRYTRQGYFERYNTTLTHCPAGSAFCFINRWQSVRNFVGAIFGGGEGYAGWKEIRSMAVIFSPYHLGSTGRDIYEIIFFSVLTNEQPPRAQMQQYKVYMYDDSGADMILHTNDITKYNTGFPSDWIHPQCLPTALVIASNSLYGYLPASCRIASPVVVVGRAKSAQIVQWRISIENGFTRVDFKTNSLRNEKIFNMSGDRMFAPPPWERLNGLLPLRASQFALQLKVDFLTVVLCERWGAEPAVYVYGQCRLFHVDLYNNFAIRAVPHVDVLFAPLEDHAVGALELGAEQPRQHFFSAGMNGSVVMMYNDTHLITTDSFQRCPKDQITYDGGLTCEWMQCLRAGTSSDMQHVVRAPGSFAFGCEPGYYFDGYYSEASSLNGQVQDNFIPAAMKCTICPLNYFCLGGSKQMIACPASRMTEAEGSASFDACICKPGFYLYLGINIEDCFRCLYHHWCRGGATPPIPCANKGVTIDGGLSSPAACRCPERTYGVSCVPCGSAYACDYSDTEMQTLHVFEISAWGTEDASEVVRYCFEPGQGFGGKGFKQYEMYSVPAIAPTFQDEAKTPSPDVVVVPLGWTVVLLNPPAGTSDAAVLDYITGCLKNAPLTETVVRRPSGDTTNAKLTGKNLVRVQRALGLHMEFVSGISMCVGGYEMTTTSQRYEICLPCLPETVRATGYTGGCYPCWDTEKMHAPNLGMTECICKEDFYPRLVTAAAAGATAAVDSGSSSFECVPVPKQSELVRILSTPLNAMLLSALCVLLVVGVCFLASLWIAAGPAKMVNEAAENKKK